MHRSGRMRFCVKAVLPLLMIAIAAGSACADEPSFSFGNLMMDRLLIPAAELSFQLPAERSHDSVVAPADTTNKALDDLLSQFMADPSSTDLSYDGWTLTAHRFLGYTILAGVATQAILGVYTYNKEKDGGVPGTADVHKYLGYTIVGLSVTQTALGFYNFWQMRDRETGKTKRWAHLTLSTLATAGFIAAAAIAYNARQDIESGQADADGKTFQDLYDTHRAVGILATASVLLTAIVIVW